MNFQFLNSNFQIPSRGTRLVSRAAKLAIGNWLLAMFLLLAGCARFHPQPISPEKSAAAFDARSLTNAELRAFLETNHITGDWPRHSWDLNALTFVAFY